MPGEPLRVQALYLKPAPGRPMVRVERVTGDRGVGLAGDCSGNRSSPRHVLIVSHDDIRTLGIQECNLRANMVVTGDLAALASGSVVDVGGLRLRITMACESCAKLNVIRPGLARSIGSRRGLLARVLSDETCRVGDHGVVLRRSAPALATDWKQRVLRILAEVPAGRVVSYATLALIAGVQTPYCRAIPGVLRSPAARGLPVHRVVPGDLTKIGNEQWAKLHGENIDTIIATSFWDGAGFHAEQEQRLHPRVQD